MSNNDLSADLKPILWKWLVRVIWIGSIAFFQIVELVRYFNGETYRPFFGLYAAILVANVLWLVALLARRPGGIIRPRA
jgi:hypothetical protein